MTTPRWVDFGDRSTYLHSFLAFMYTDFIIIYEGTTSLTCGKLYRGGWTGPPSPPTKPVLTGHESKLGHTGWPASPRDPRGGDRNRMPSRSPRTALAGVG